MKKLLFFSFILSLLFNLSFSFSVKGQDSTEIAWAKHIKNAIDIRPNPELFTKEEAWKVLTGENNGYSKEYTLSQTEYGYFNLLKKVNISVEDYSRSSTSSKDDWWYSTIRSFNEGTWKINWPFAIPFFVSILILIMSFTMVKKYYLNAKKRMGGNPNMFTPIREIEIVLFIVGCLFFLISFFDRDFGGLIIIPILILLLSYQRIKIEIKKLEK